MIRTIIAILLTMTCLNVYAENQAKVLKKGEVAPFNGVLLSDELEHSVRTELQTNKEKIEKLKKINELSEQEIEVLTKRMELHRKIVNEYADREAKTENTSFLKNTLYFISGALITGIIAHGVNR
jgi:hypothetical protein